MPACHGQTDRRTDRRTELLYQYRASAAVCWRAIKTGAEETRSGRSLVCTGPNYKGLDTPLRQCTLNERPYAYSWKNNTVGLPAARYSNGYPIPKLPDSGSPTIQVVLLSSRKVLVLEDSRGPIHNSLSLDHKVLENNVKDFAFCKYSGIYDHVVRKFGYRRRICGYGEEWLTYWYQILLIIK